MSDTVLARMPESQTDLSNPDQVAALLRRVQDHPLQVSDRTSGVTRFVELTHNEKRRPGPIKRRLLIGRLLGR